MKPGNRVLEHSLGAFVREPLQPHAIAGASLLAPCLAGQLDGRGTTNSSKIAKEERNSLATQITKLT